MKRSSLRPPNSDPPPEVTVTKLVQHIQKNSQDDEAPDDLAEWDLMAKVVTLVDGSFMAKITLLPPKHSDALPISVPQRLTFSSALEAAAYITNWVRAWHESME